MSPWRILVLIMERWNISFALITFMNGVDFSLFWDYIKMMQCELCDDDAK